MVSKLPAGMLTPHSGARPPLAIAWLGGQNSFEAGVSLSRKTGSKGNVIQRIIVSRTAPIFKISLTLVGRYCKVFTPPPVLRNKTIISWSAIPLIAALVEILKANYQPL